MTGSIEAIRHLAEEDIGTADDLLKLAFGSAHSFSGALRQYWSIQPDGWFVAVRSGIPVGMVGAVDYGRFAYVGMMAVHPAARRQGVGRALMRHVLGWLNARRCPAVLLDATEAGYHLYASFGFRELSRTCTFVRQDASPHEVRASDHVRLARPEDLSEMVAFDEPIFGADRGVALKVFLRDWEGRFFIVHDEAGRIAGYLCAQERNLGPWVARGSAEAEALLQAVLSLQFAEAPQVIVPEMNRAAATVLQRNGFQLARTLRHMKRGEGELSRRVDLLYGQRSFAIG